MATPMLIRQPIARSVVVAHASRRPVSSHSIASASLYRLVGRLGCFPQQTAVCIGRNERNPVRALPVRVAHTRHVHQQSTRFLSNSKNVADDQQKESSGEITDAGSNLDQSESSAAAAADESVSDVLESTEENFGESTTTTSNDEVNDNPQELTQFPWRHECEETPRLLEKDDYSGMPNNWRARFVRRVVACRELNMTPFDAIPIPFFGRAWEDELADNFQLAFGMALEELLTSMFRGRARVKRDDDGTISIDSSVRNTADDHEEHGNDKIKMEDDEYLNRMLDKDLIAKYQYVDVDNFHLKLSVRPIEATLEHIFAIPLLSREIVEKKPHLRGGYQRIEQAFLEKNSYGTIKQMTYDLAREVGEEDAYVRTVIADATIECSEFFQIKDANSGEVIRGMEDGQEEEAVVHNVRFEVVTEKSDDESVARKVGSWKIIDIDDLLEGNVFH